MEDLERFSRETEDSWLLEIVLFAARTGLRRGELLNLTWDRVDLSSRTIRVQSSLSYTVKHGKMRTVPLNETAMRVLLNQPKREGLVFPGRRGGMANPNYVSKVFRDQVRRLGLDRKLHFHSLRHTFASLLVRHGVSLYHVQKLLGHNSSRVTEIYAHLQSGELHSQVGLLDHSSPLRSKNTTARAHESRKPKDSNASSSETPRKNTDAGLWADLVKDIQWSTN